MTRIAPAGGLAAAPCLFLVAVAYRESGKPEYWALDGLERAAAAAGAASGAPVQRPEPAVAPREDGREEHRPIVLELRSSSRLSHGRGAGSSGSASAASVALPSPPLTPRADASQANQSAANASGAGGEVIQSAPPMAVTVKDLEALRDRTYAELRQAFTVLYTGVYSERKAVDSQAAHVQDCVLTAVNANVDKLRNVTERFSRQQQRLMIGARHGVSGMCCCKQLEATAIGFGFGGASCQWVTRRHLHGGRRDKCPPAGEDALPWQYLDVRSPGGAAATKMQVDTLLDECIGSENWAHYVAPRGGAESTASLQ